MDNLDDFPRWTAVDVRLPRAILVSWYSRDPIMVVEN